MGRYVLWQQVGGNYTSSNVCYSHSDGGTLPYIPLELESAAGYYLGTRIVRSAGEQFSTIDWLRPPYPDSSHETNAVSRLFTPRTSVLHSPDARLVSGSQGIGHITTSNARTTRLSKAMSPYILGSQGRWQRSLKCRDTVTVTGGCTQTVKALNLNWMVGHGHPLGYSNAPPSLVPLYRCRRRRTRRSSSEKVPAQCQSSRGSNTPSGKEVMVKARVASRFSKRPHPLPQFAKDERRNYNKIATLVRKRWWLRRILAEEWFIALRARVSRQNRST